MLQQAGNKNRYRIVSKLCSGGMADIFLGVQLDQEVLDRLVVVKKIHTAPDADGDSSKMFADEARIVSTLSHPHVVQLYDFTTTGDDFNIVMEYIDGENLGYILYDLRKRNMRMPLAIALRLMEQALEALEYIHTALSRNGEPLNIVHRDLDPRNLMVDSNGYLKVIDFGVAKAVVQTELTAPGLFKGKLSHVAPEIFSKEDIDHRADIYSAGLVLFELLTGEKPYRFGKDTLLVDTIRRITDEPIPRPSELNPAIPPAIEAIVLKACEKNRDARYQTAEALHSALKEAAYAGKPHVGIASNAEVKEWLHTHFEKRLAKRRAFESATLQKAKQLLSGIRPSRPAGARTSVDPERSGLASVPSDDPGSALRASGLENGSSMGYYLGHNTGKHSDFGSEVSFARFGTSSVPPTAFGLGSTPPGENPRASRRYFIKVTALTASLAIVSFLAFFLYFGDDAPPGGSEDSYDGRGSAAAASAAGGMLSPSSSTDENESAAADTVTPSVAALSADSASDPASETTVASVSGSASEKARAGYHAPSWRRRRPSARSNEKFDEAAEPDDAVEITDENDNITEDEESEGALGDNLSAPIGNTIGAGGRMTAPPPEPVLDAPPIAADPPPVQRPVESEVQLLSGDGNWSGPTAANKGCGSCHATPSATSKTASQWEYFFSHNRHRKFEDLRKLFSSKELHRVESYLITTAEKQNAKSSGIAGVR